MERITHIIILYVFVIPFNSTQRLLLPSRRLIVIACLVEFGEVMARLVVHESSLSVAQKVAPLSRDDALRTLERMAGL
jgi:hypothetical protein